MSPTPFRIAISESKLQRLKQKLALVDFPDEVINLDDPWSRGCPLADIKRLTEYWASEFDWRRAEARLNEFPQYMAKIEVEGFDAHDVHFIHQQSAVVNAIPLLFVHGWPGSFIEATKMLPSLVDDGKDYPAFHVVAPSLINFGFSGASMKKGFGIEQHAETCHKLMLSLGYTEYVVQGGDLGYIVTRFIAMKYGPKYCKAYHLNNTAPVEPTASSHPELYEKIKNTPLTEPEIAGLGQTQKFFGEGQGYFKEQGTKPQTIGYSLADSPVGLLSWIYEKLHDWSDNYAWTDDEILTWVSIYYFSTAGPAASSSIYYEMEHRQPPALTAAQVYVDVPLGIARFPKDVVLLPKLWNQTLGPIVLEREHEKGGHFGSTERPDDIVKDLHEMFGKGGGAYGCVHAKSGYKD